MSNRRIGGYELVEKIGHGSTGRVWRARRIATDDVVAVKELRSEFADDDEARARFLAEGQLLKEHPLPGVVRVHDVIDDAETVAIVMDLVDGVTLRDVVVGEAPLSPRRAVALTRGISESLAAAHAGGLVHGDVKPENVLVVDRGLDTESTVLTDFGLARVVRSAGVVNTRSQAMGTPHYAAPEIHKGERRDRPADLYALGVILYELMVGRRPFEAPNVEAVMRGHLDDPPARTGDFSGPIWHVTAACLAKGQSERPDARELSLELARILDLGLTTPEVLPTSQWHRAAPEREVKMRRGGRFLAGVAAAVALVIVSGVAVGMSWEQSGNVQADDPRGGAAPVSKVAPQANPTDPPPGSGRAKSGTTSAVMPVVESAPATPAPPPIPAGPQHPSVNREGQAELPSGKVSASSHSHQPEEAAGQAELTRQQQEAARQTELTRQQNETARQTELKRQQQKAAREAELKRQAEQKRRIEERSRPRDGSTFLQKTCGGTTMATRWHWRIQGGKRVFTRAYFEVSYADPSKKDEMRLAAFTPKGRLDINGSGGGVKQRFIVKHRSRESVSFHSATVPADMRVTLQMELVPAGKSQNYCSHAGWLQ